MMMTMTMTTIEQVTFGQGYNLPLGPDLAPVQSCFFLQCRINEVLNVFDTVGCNMKDIWTSPFF